MCIRDSMGEEQIARAMIEDVRQAVAAGREAVDTRGSTTAPALSE